jgi:hypothetical protein
MTFPIKNMVLLDISEIIKMFSQDVMHDKDTLLLNEFKNEDADLVESEDYSFGCMVNGMGLLSMIEIDDLLDAGFSFKILKKYLVYILLHLKLLTQISNSIKEHTHTKDKLTDFQKRRLNYYAQYLNNGLAVMKNVNHYFHFFFHFSQVIDNQKSSELFQAIALTTEVKDGNLIPNTKEMIQGCLSELKVVEKTK